MIWSTWTFSKLKAKADAFRVLGDISKPTIFNRSAREQIIRGRRTMAAEGRWPVAAQAKTLAELANLPPIQIPSACVEGHAVMAKPKLRLCVFERIPSSFNKLRSIILISRTKLSRRR
ncbi:MAG: hypothetical protein WBD71_00050 [Xanthobacteraceae bacterium]